MPGSELTGLLREMPCYCADWSVMPSVPPKCGRCQALALAEDLEREWANCAQHLAVARGLQRSGEKQVERLLQELATKRFALKRILDIVSFAADHAASARFSLVTEQINEIGQQARLALADASTEATT